MIKPISTQFGSFLLPADVARSLAEEKVNGALSGGYDGASKRRRSMRDWRAAGSDADSALLDDLGTLRDRSSDLIRNNPLAGGAISTKNTSVIGSGLWMKSAVNREYLGLSEEQAEAFESQVEFEFSVLSKNIGIAGQSFADLQSTAYRSHLEKGDVLAVLTNSDRKNHPYQLAVQLIESERLCNKDFARDSKNHRAGIIRSNKGMPTKYQILTVHPGSDRLRKREWIELDAFNENGHPNVLHLFKELRPGQTRGVPDLAPVIEPLKQLGKYTEAELMAAVISGMFTVFIKTEGDDMPSSKSASDIDLKMGSGTIVGLDVNESIETATPGRPNAGFDAFFMAIVREIGVGLELPFEILIKHFSSSYSASRAAMLEAWRYFLKERKWFADKFCQPIYEAFVDEGVAMGRFYAPGYFSDPFIRAAYLGARWNGPPRGHIDELKEAKAAEIYNKLGAKPLEEITMEVTGGDWERNHRQLTKEKRLRDRDGLTQETGPEAGFLMPGETDEDSN